MVHELATKVYILASGLQNAAPPGGSGGKSIQYLLTTATELEKTSQLIESLVNDNSSLKYK